VVLASGQRLAYDRLVVSPGIDLKLRFRAGMVEGRRGSDAARLEAGKQTRLVKEKLDKVPNGGVIVMVAPPNPTAARPAPMSAPRCSPMC